MNRPDRGGSADAAIRSGSTSFALASRLFDPATRLRVWQLYAWCRHCDDVTDGQILGHGQKAVGDRTARVEELRRIGISDADLARISAPIGLDIGARTPEETAISIAAEIIALRENRRGGRLTEGTLPVHNDRSAVTAT